MMTSKRKMLARGALLLSCLAMGVAYSGCAQDVGTIDRTRPDKLKKSIFSGDDEWYYLQTVISTDFQASHGIGVAEQSLLKRIRWTITEDTLFAYSTTEPAVGISDGLKGSKDRRLGVVAAFPIIKHFDVQRGYNSSTGQLSNVVEENSSDRLWYDREYMRVDWGGNRIDGVSLMTSEFGRYASVERTVPEADFASDYDRARISNDYIDVVTEYYFEPSLFTCAYGLGFDTYRNCEAGPVKVRNSFKRIKKKKTYEPVPYFDYEELKGEDGKPIKVASYLANDVACTPEIKQALYLQQGETADQDVCTETAKFDLFKRFGYFRTEQPVYTQRRGSQYLAGKRYYANTFNIWHTAYDDDGNLLPLEERKPKQIVYYLNVAFPDDGDDGPYTRGWKKLQEAWNKVFMNTVKLTHNIVDLTEEGGYYNWIRTLISELAKLDKVSFLEDGIPPEDILQVRLGIEGDEVIPGSPLSYALEWMNGANKQKTSWDAFCDSKVASGLGLDSSACTAVPVDNSDEVKTAVVKALKGRIGELLKQQERKQSVEGELSFANAPFVATLLELARTYLETPQQQVDTGKYETPSISSVDVGKYKKALLALSGVVGSKEVKKEFKKLLRNVQFRTEKDDPVKRLVRDNNRFDPSGHENTDDEASHMFLIKENSCSPKMLMKWKGSYGDLNEEVQSLFSGKTRDSLRKLPLEDLQKFCARLEWATREYAKDDSTQSDPRHFDWQRQGDLRYNFITWVPERVFWLGLGPTASDPQTGEVISGVANFAGEAVEGYAASAADLQMFFDGRLTEDELITGSFVTDEFEEKGLAPDSFLRMPNEASAVSTANANSYAGVSASSLSSFLGDLAGSSEKIEVTTKSNVLSALDTKRLADLSRNLEKASKSLSPQAQSLDYRRFLKIQDEKAKQIAKISQDPAVIAARLTSPEYAALLDVIGKERFGDRELTQDERDSIIAELAAPTLALRREDAEKNKLALRNVYPREALDHALNATISAKAGVEFLKNKTRKEIEDYFREGVFFGTQVHEVGHTLGLRHNFIGSYDALNYQRQYWDVEAAMAAKSPVLKKAHYDDNIGYLSEADLKQISPEGSAGTMGYFDKAGYRYSSVMDYTSGSNSGFAGVGTYDEAAIQFVYAKRLQVFDKPVSLPKLKRFALAQGFVDYKDLPSLFRPDDMEVNDAIEYYNGIIQLLLINKRINLPQAKQWADLGLELRSDAIRRMTHGRRWITVEEAKQRTVNGLAERAKLLTDELKNVGSFDGNALDDEKHKPLAREFYWSDSLTLVPYKFCTDDYRGSETGCDVFDWGANQEEILDYKIDSFRMMKNRLRYARGRNNDAFRNYGTYYGYLARLFSSVQEPFYRYVNYVLVRGLNLFAYTDSLKRASVTGFNFITQIYAQPQPGKYCPRDSKNPTNLTPDEKDVDLYVPYGDVKKRNARGQDEVVGCAEDKQLIIDRDNGVVFDYDLADTYRLQLKRLPGYIDRDLAIAFLFLVSGDYVGKDLSSDVLANRGSFWTAFNDEVYDFLKGVILQEPEYYAGTVQKDSSGKLEYVPPTPITEESLKAYEENKVPKQPESKPHIKVVATFNDGYDALLYSLILNNTPLDDQSDMIQYVKVCASSDECDRDYIDIDTSFNGTIPAGEVGAGEYKNGRRVVSYDVEDPDDSNKIIASLTDVPSTTYRTSAGIIVKTFVHPELPIIYRVPLARNGKSITGEIIDTLNDWVYGQKEPSYDAIVNRDNKVLLAGWYFKDKKALEDVKKKGAGAEGFTVAKKEFDGTKGVMEFYISKLDVIRDIMKKTGGLY